MKTILLKGGRILCPAGKIDETGDILIKDGLIALMGGEINETADQVIDCSGKVTAPGLIDPHVHLREPGEEYKETIASGTHAAARGGYTAVAPMPNTNPVNDSLAVSELMMIKAERAGFAKVHPVAAITIGLKGENLTEMGELKAAGCMAVSDDGMPVRDSRLLRRAMEYASTFDLPVICHSEDKELSAGGVMHEGPTATRMGLTGIPAQAEVVGIERDLQLAALTGARVHIAHVSCKGSVEAVKRAKEAGLSVSCETAPHYLTLIDRDIGEYNTNAKMNPPLRSAGDREAVRNALAQGVIDMVATDHAPQSILEKEVEFDIAAFGVIGLETALGVVLKLVHQGLISLEQALERMSAAPARVFGLNGGSLKKGGPADVVIIDPQAEWVVEPEKFKSLSRNCPFAGMKLKGRAVMTICQGRITYQQEEV